ncbi:unnamed protein product [Plutella xylostella]|uniref:sulfite oxidase n=1 Tax=Plutella xylostella TaxID=51655 RepID=A0A8S4G5C5_PLUXY|nr:unnamed protein product [Plutella xylostella]
MIKELYYNGSGAVAAVLVVVASRPITRGGGRGVGGAATKTLSRPIRFSNVVSVLFRDQKYDEYQGKNSRSSQGFKYQRVIGAALLGAALVSSHKVKLSTTGKESSGGSADSPVEAGARRPDLPTFRADEVSQHDNKKSFWVIYKNGVYDVTKFLVSHPGGEQILNAGGLSIEPFWNVYGMHHTKQVYEVLESYRIGNLHEDDIVDHSNDELWAKEPYRRKELIVKTAKPFNAEVPPKIQVDHFDTPNDLFFVRQHMAVPELDPLTHRVTITVRGAGGKEGGEARSFSMEDLDKFPQVTVRAALMCAGNRRSEMNKVKPVKGIEWGGGAISNSVWGGVYLRDVLIHCGVSEQDLEGKHVVCARVLIHCGVSEKDMEGKHVVFNGADLDATGHHFSTSMPLHMVMDPRAKVLLARTMNGQPLPRDHGCPLRVLVPGAPAVRSVKWLESITVSTEESKGHWHTSDYRSLNPSVTWETVDFASAPPLYSLPVTSYICDVKREKDELVIRGYAYSGGGARIVRVDISTDRGASWRPCACAAADPAPPAQHYAWLLWTARVPAGSCSEYNRPRPASVRSGSTPRRPLWLLWTARVPACGSEVELWVKATDSNFNTQPETFDNIWNIRGVLSNAYHRVKVQL